MAYSSIVKTLRDGSIVFADNAGAHTLTLGFEMGDVSIDIPGPEVLLFLVRNRITSPPAIRFGKDNPITGSFTFMLRDLDDANTALYLAEQLVVKGAIDGWTSTMGASGEVPTYTMTFAVEGTNHGDAEDNSIVLPYTHVTGSIKEGDPTTISGTFTSFVTYPSSVT